MSSITDWIQNELYPALFDSIDTAFPEHDFKRFAGGWRSKTYLFGEGHKTREDKTVITKRSPGWILEQGGENMSLVDYVMKRDSFEFIQAAQYLAKLAGLQLPTIKDYNPEEYKNREIQISILHECQDYFTWNLKDNKGSEATAVRTYLKSRGYDETDIAGMDLGFIPSQQHLIKHLQDKKFSQGAIDEAIKFSAGIGSSHRLTIPYLSGGTLKGFKFRIADSNTQTATGKGPGKYLNSSDLDKKGGFFNLSGIKGVKDLIIVEGELDALHATVKGINNVVATTGNSISPEQVQNAIKKGAKSFTICFDTEPGQEQKTVNSVNSAIKIILGEGINDVYVLTLPDLGDGKTDPDRFIKCQGPDEFKTQIKDAQTYYEYWLLHAISAFYTIKDPATRDIHNLLNEIVEIADRIEHPSHKDIYKSTFLADNGIKNLGISPESLTETITRLTFTRVDDLNKKAMNKAAVKAQGLIAEGKTAEAARVLENAGKAAQSTGIASGEMQQMTRAGFQERLSEKPESLHSGYCIGERKVDIQLQSGALSFFAAPSGHGKTRFLLNMALNVVAEYPLKKVYFFSYEEGADQILLKAFNIYQGKEVAANNLVAIESYFKGNDNSLGKKSGDLQHIKSKDNDFFTDLIDTNRLNVHYTSMRIGELNQIIRDLKNSGKIDAVFIDYIQLITLDPGKFNTHSRQEETKQICLILNDLAADTQLPIILGAQFNREVKSHSDLHMNRLGEAGDIERIASLIVGFFDNSKDPDTINESYNAKHEITQGPSIHVKILKNRTGASGATGNIGYLGITGKMKTTPKF